jgi:murein L,D-transpeptidase YcbB/YkuD
MIILQHTGTTKSRKMRYLYLSLISIAIILVFANGACKLKDKRPGGNHLQDHLHGALNHQSNMPFDSNLVTSFYQSYPALSQYKNDVTLVYRRHSFTHIWYDAKGIVEFGQTLFSKTKELDLDGVSALFPYQDKIDSVFENDKENTLTPTETEIMLTNLYLFYADKVFKGLDDTTTTALGWLLPRKEVSYTLLLDSIISDPQLLNRDDSILFGQYYKLRDVLVKYREIEKQGGWNAIDLNPKIKAYKPEDTAKAIQQIRDRLFITGELKQNSKSNRYDPELAEAVEKYQRHNGFNPTESILPEHIRQMNLPVGNRIRKIIVNMERCRWISPEFGKAKEYIVVNIPSFKLTMVHNGKIELESPVIVGRNVTKTLIFSSMLSYIVFSPYWNVPPSIIKNEIKPGIAKNPNYLEAHNMEWNNGQVRQKPGKNNSLGLVKFIFPNTNDIYMHDTPAKSLFAQESRAFSHGCIRVGKPRDLAIAILQDDPNWTPQKIDAAMNAGIEYSYVLKNKIPVYIGYLTAWVNARGEINFYEDIYKRDDRLEELILSR